MVVSRKLGPSYKNLDRGTVNAFNKALIIEMRPELHKIIKERARERNISMRLWATRAIIKGLKEEFKVL